MAIHDDQRCATQFTGLDAEPAEHPVREAELAGEDDAEDERDGGDRRHVRDQDAHPEQRPEPAAGGSARRRAARASRNCGTVASRKMPKVLSVAFQKHVVGEQLPVVLQAGEGVVADELPAVQRDPERVDHRERAEDREHDEERRDERVRRALRVPAGQAAAPRRPRRPARRRARAPAARAAARQRLRGAGRPCPSSRRGRCPERMVGLESGRVRAGARSHARPGFVGGFLRPGRRRATSADADRAAQVRDPRRPPPP